MFRSFSPTVQLFSLMTAGILSLFKSSKKTRTSGPAAGSTPATNHSRSPYYDRVQKVVAAHADCTAEIFNIFVHGAGKVRIFSELIPGDRVDLRLRDDEVSVYVDGKYMSTPLLLSDSSRLRSLLESDADIDAFLGGRDVSCCSDDAEFCSIIAFYKIKGVPPTRISVE